jgi:hypothetical protein
MPNRRKGGSLVCPCRCRRGGRLWQLQALALQVQALQVQALQVLALQVLALQVLALQVLALQVRRQEQDHAHQRWPEPGRWPGLA